MTNDDLRRRLNDAWRIYRDKHDEAIAVAKDVYATTQDTTIKLAARNLEARAYVIADDYGQAYQLAQAVLQAAPPELWDERATAYHTCGFVNRLTGLFADALRDHHHEYDIRCEHDDLSGQARALEKIGAVHIALLHVETAIDYIQQAMDIYKAISDRVGQSQTLNTLASIHGRSGNHEMALHFLEGSQALVAGQDAYQEAIVLSNLGTAYGATGHFEKSEAVLKKALALHQKFGSKRQQAVVLHNLSNLISIVQAPDVTQAIAYAQQSYELATEANSVFDRMKSAEALAGLHESIEDYAQAYHWLKIYHNLVSAHYSITHANELKRLEFRYRAEINQKEVQRLRDYNRVLEADRERYRKLTELKDDFINSVSHDLKTPLTGIFFNIDMIERYGYLTDDRIRKIRDRMYHYALQMQELVMDILDLARIDSMVNTQKETHKVDDLLEFLNYGFADDLKERGVTLDYAVEPEDLQARFNAHQMQRLVVNLASNAIKYTPTGGRVIIRAFHDDDILVLTVRDSGPGIPEADLPHIFKPFYRVKGTSLVDGTGLGLSIVRAIVEQHDGTITVHNNPDAGVTFTVRLPQRSLI
jgi:signal transduction histidine kinase